jgi:hypothetical protein
MPFFLILPLWLLCIMVGVGLLFVIRLRFLATHILLVSSGAVFASLVLSTVLLLVAGRAVGGTRFAFLALVIYLLGILAGGVAGALAGFMVALKVNRRLGWQ